MTIFRYVRLIVFAPKLLDACKGVVEALNWRDAPGELGELKARQLRAGIEIIDKIEGDFDDGGGRDGSS